MTRRDFTNCALTALALGGAALALAVGTVGSVNLSHFAPVRFKLPPGATVEVNGGPERETVYLNTRLTHSFVVRRNGSVLYERTDYTPPRGGETFDLRPKSDRPAAPVPVAPHPRPKESP